MFEGVVVQLISNALGDKVRPMTENMLISVVIFVAHLDCFSVVTLAWPVSPSLLRHDVCCVIAVHSCDESRLGLVVAMADGVDACSREGKTCVSVAVRLIVFFCRQCAQRL